MALATVEVPVRVGGNAQEIALCDDSIRPGVFNPHQQRTDPLFRHLARCLTQLCSGVDEVDRLAHVIDQPVLEDEGIHS